MRLADGSVRKFRRSVEDPGCAHELTFSCYRRLPLLTTDWARRLLVDALRVAREKHQLELWSYVIMPEHVHLLFVPLDPEYRVRSVLQAIKQPVARRAIRRLREVNSGRVTELADPRTGRVQFWQPGGGYDRNVVSSATAWRIVAYAHHNPVKRGLVQRPVDWTWSSACWYAGEGEIVLPMDGVPPGAPPRGVEY